MRGQPRHGRCQPKTVRRMQIPAEEVLPDCVLAPHFPASDPQRYAYVQRIFGAGNVSRMLQQLPVQERGRAADAMAVEAHRRAQDPVYGCAEVINRLQEEIRAVQCELGQTRAQIAMHRALPPTNAQMIPLQQQRRQEEDDDEKMQAASFEGVGFLSDS